MKTTQRFLPAEGDAVVAAFLARAKTTSASRIAPCNMQESCDGLDRVAFLLCPNLVTMSHTLSQGAHWLLGVSDGEGSKSPSGS